ncbi:hypothetical protein Tco_0737810 [Tanacetum coccineum]
MSTNSSSSSSSHDEGDGGREFEEPSHSRQRFNTAVWPEPFLEALATQVAIDAVTSSGRLAAAPAICNLFQWKDVSNNKYILEIGLRSDPRVDILH